MKKLYIEDALMQMQCGFGLHDNAPDNYKEYRYEERSTEYALRCWCNGRETSSGGGLSTRPQWLVDIINLAKVGGHTAKVREPPPDCIVWFQTDTDNNLQAFKEMRKQ
jgi:hypothetical protein